MSSHTPFNDPQLRDWYFGQIDLPEELSAMLIVVDGSGPFDCADFIRFLVQNGGDAVPISDGETSEILIVGEFAWSCEGIAKFIRARAGSRLRIYSQEMFLLYWASALDPFDSADRETLERFRLGHLGLSGFAGCCPEFDWPTTHVPENPSGAGGVKPSIEQSPSPGLLSVAGYHTGKNSSSARRRREILENLYLSGDLRRDYPTEKIGLRGTALANYIDSWGPGNSSLRLQKMAETIASLARNAKNSTRNMDVSVAQWEADLAWLKSQYYPGKFYWPIT